MNTKEGDMDMLLPGRSYNLFDDFFNNDFFGRDFRRDELFQACTFSADVCS